MYLNPTLMHKYLHLDKLGRCSPNYHLLKLGNSETGKMILSPLKFPHMSVQLFSKYTLVYKQN